MSSYSLLWQILQPVSNKVSPKLKVNVLMVRVMSEYTSNEFKKTFKNKHETNDTITVAMPIFETKRLFGITEEDYELSRKSGKNLKKELQTLSHIDVQPLSTSPSFHFH